MKRQLFHALWTATSMTIALGGVRVMYGELPPGIETYRVVFGGVLVGLAIFLAYVHGLREGRRA